MIGKKLTFAASLLALLLSSPALASRCPVDAGAVADAIERSKLPSGKKEEIRALHDQGLEQHNAGDHAAAEATLAEAMRMLLKGGLRK